MSTRKNKSLEHLFVVRTTFYIILIYLINQSDGTCMYAKKRKPRASSIKMEEGENLIAGALDEGQGKTLIIL